MRGLLHFSLFFDQGQSSSALAKRLIFVAAFVIATVASGVGSTAILGSTIVVPVVDVVVTISLHRGLEITKKIDGKHKAQ